MNTFLLLHSPPWMFSLILSQCTVGLCLWRRIDMMLPEISSWKKVSSKIVTLLTHHEVRDGRKDEDGQDAVWYEVSKHFGKEVDRGAVETTRVLMAAGERNMWWWSLSNRNSRVESSCLEVDSHEEHSLADEELHRRQITKHHVNDQEKESSRSEERRFTETART